METEQMSIDSKKGTKVIYTGKNGYDSQLIRANKHLTIGNIYTVDYIVIHGFSTEVFLQEIPDVSFNSVHFIQPPTEDKVDELSCECDPDWECLKCGYIYTSKVTTDGHCKTCGGQVKQREHTKGNVVDVKELTQKIDEISLKWLGKVILPNITIGDRMKNAMRELIQFTQSQTN